MLQKPVVSSEYGLRSHGVKKVPIDSRECVVLHIIHVIQVLRHCMNGDLLLVNRQPTLHKSSIMVLLELGYALDVYPDY